jgi:hypothetical protein
VDLIGLFSFVTMASNDPRPKVDQETLGLWRKEQVNNLLNEGNTSVLKQQLSQASKNFFQPPALKKLADSVVPIIRDGNSSNTKQIMIRLGTTKQHEANFNNIVQAPIAKQYTKWKDSMIDFFLSQFKIQEKKTLKRFWIMQHHCIW